jgi:hypothetical protein
MMGENTPNQVISASLVSFKTSRTINVISNINIILPP